MLHQNGWGGEWDADRHQDYSATIGGQGRDAQIASVHHYGLADQANADGPSDVYPARPLTGIAPADLATARRLILARLAPELP